MCAERWPPENYQNTAVASPKSGQLRPTSCTFGQNRAAIDRHRDQYQLKLHKVGRACAGLGPNRTKFAEIAQPWSNPGRIWTTPDQRCRSEVECGRTPTRRTRPKAPRFGRTRAKSDPTRAKFGRTAPSSVEICRPRASTKFKTTSRTRCSLVCPQGGFADTGPTFNRQVLSFRRRWSSHSWGEWSTSTRHLVNIRCRLKVASFALGGI